MNPLKVYLLVFVFLFSGSLFAQKILEKKSCNKTLDNLTYTDPKAKLRYINAIEHRRDDFQKSKIEWKKSGYLISIAYNHYCLESDIDSVNHYLRKSFLMDGGYNICRIIKHTQHLHTLPNPEFHKANFLIEGATLFDYPYLDFCSTYEFNKEEEAYKISELETLRKKDQKFRESIINRKDTIAQKQWALDSLIRQEFVELYHKKEKEFNQPLSNKDRMAIFLIFIHAPYQFIEDHITIVDTLSQHDNISMFDFVIDRYFCGKYGKTPIGRYCEKDESLVPELKRLFPTYQINE